MSNYWRDLETLTSVKQQVLDGTTDETEQDKLAEAFDLILNAYETVSAPEEAA